MADFNEKGKYLTAEVRFRYNEREGVIELTSKDPELSAKGFMHRIYPEAQAGRAVLFALEEHIPSLKETVSPPEFPNEPTALPEDEGEPFKIPLGIGQKGEEIFWDVVNNAHALITGRAGSGKSLARTVILRHLQKHPDDWGVCGIDLVEKFREDHLQAEMPAGSVVMDSYASATMAIRSIREKIDEGFPLDKNIMVVIDNFGILMGEYHADENMKLPLDKRKHNYDLLEDLIYISRVGRSVGVHLCLITQRASEEDLPSPLRSNILFRYAIGKHSNIGSMMAIDTISAARLAEAKVGEGVVSSLNEGEFFIQGYYPPPKAKK